MVRNGYRQNQAYHTLFVNDHRGKVTTLILYVDDIVIPSNDPYEIKSLRSYLEKQYEIKDLSQLRYFLGIELWFDPRWESFYHKENMS